MPPEIPRSIAELDTLLHLPLAWTASGVYFLCEGDEVVYVGRSLSVLHRIAEHIKASVKEFSHVFFLPCAIAELDEIEQRWIKTLNPKYNFVHGERRAPRRNKRTRGTVIQVTEGRWRGRFGRIEEVQGKDGFVYFTYFDDGGEVIPLEFLELATNEQIAEWDEFMPSDEEFYRSMDSRPFSPLRWHPTESGWIS